ncbi:hypothetical protein BCV70DRAFT_197878 [Testicularia cyperi]|uniref:Uncharacterized protein n=1 Tax=Testicularia cyperi TaxID=1882483 RepID=A0A317Y0T1_9BASI|nr:hypothetical protein BCV70DRAFT_197878 [Testicularia cyperi]
MLVTSSPRRPRSRHTRPRGPSKLAAMMALFFLQTMSSPQNSFGALAASDPGTSEGSWSMSHLFARDSWRPDTEKPGAPFVLGDGKNEGVKVIGYEGEWPLWSEFRSKQIKLDDLSGHYGSDSDPQSSQSQDSTSSDSDTTSDNAAQGALVVCVAIGECSACPIDVLHFPYCRPYNNRRRVACEEIENPSDPASVQRARLAAPKSSMLGWEACGKSARKEARDYFELIVVLAGVAIASVWVFIHRQKVLFQRQNEQLQFRVSGTATMGRRRMARLAA